MDESNENPIKRTDENIRLRGVSNESDKSKSKVNEEYFRALEQWLNDVRSYRYSCSFFGFPYSMLTQPITGFPAPQGGSGNNNLPFPIPNFQQGFQMFPFTNPQLHQQQQNNLEEGVEHIIPPLWKRFGAESIDFILLFIMKMAVTLTAIDFFDFVDLDKYDSFHQNKKMDYKIAIEITSELLFLEMVHRLIVCLYEGLFLRKGVANQIGGATPGKTFMGIKVIFCENVIQVENRPNVVKVIPATDLGLGRSFARAFVKNLLLALLFPICFPLFFNKFNRTAYDVLCHSIVVEDRVQTNRNR